MREHLEAEARKGSVVAIAQLQGPGCPQEMEYLIGYSWQLIGRSGTSFDGLEPLSYTEIEAWCRLTGYTLSPLEVDALILLDAVVRNPDGKFGLLDEGEPGEEAQKRRTAPPQWPKSKATAQFQPEDD